MIKIETPDLPQALKALQELNGNAPKALARGLRAWAELTMGPIRKATPVDTGALRGSLGIRPHSKAGVEGMEFFAGGPAAPYAVYVHENLNAKVNWNARGTGPKFIENPLKERLTVLDVELATELNKEVARLFPK